MDFGVWRTSELKRLFPRRDFDWLDVTLLQRSILAKKVIVCETEPMLTIGTWNWANKTANAVNGRNHRALLSIAKSFANFARHGYLFNRSEAIEFYVESLGRFRLARRLNADLLEKRK